MTLGSRILRAFSPIVIAWGSVLGLALQMGAAAPSRAEEPSRTLVLPLRTIGVSDTIAAVVGDLLQGELESRGVVLVPSGRVVGMVPTGESACDDVDCAAAAAESLGASRVVYGSLSRLGDKIFARIRALHVGGSAPYYADQITATTVEDLDTVVRRATDGIAAGRPDADRVTIDTVTQEETLEPRRRASRSGLGLRAGFLVPLSNSYGDVDRLTNLRLAFKYETRNLLIDVTPMLGAAWRGQTIEWSLLDVFAARIFSTGDWAPYLGGGLGVHSLRVEKTIATTRTIGGSVYPYETSVEESETTLTADVGVGLLTLRTYDFMIVLDLRFHYVFANFDKLGGDGAYGISFTFGTSR